MAALANLSPLGQLRAGKLGRRLTNLVIGQMLFGASMAMMIRAGLGTMPWDVLHVGLAKHLPLTFGQTVVAVAIALLALWWPLKQMPGLGTLMNAFAIGIAADATLRLLPGGLPLAAAIALMLGGVLLNAFATGLYIGAQFGAGPRDGLFTGLARATGKSIRLVRTGIEVVVVTAGWLLGGVLGLGTVVYALAIGPLTQLFLPRLTIELESNPRRPKRQAP